METLSTEWTDVDLLNRSKGEWLTETLWPESASELYRPSDHRLAAKLVPTFADRECRVVSTADPLWP
jgi:hypothetical protein